MMVSSLQVAPTSPTLGSLSVGKETRTGTKLSCETRHSTSGTERGSFRVLEFLDFLEFLEF